MTYLKNLIADSMNFNFNVAINTESRQKVRVFEDLCSENSSDLLGKLLLGHISSSSLKEVIFHAMISGH